MGDVVRIFVAGEVGKPSTPKVQCKTGMFRGSPYALINVEDRHGGGTLVLSDPVACDALEDAVAQARVWLAGDESPLPPLPAHAK